MRFLLLCLVSIDSSSRSHFETVRNFCDIRKLGELSSKNALGRGTTCTGTSAYNTCFNNFLANCIGQQTSAVPFADVGTWF